ncbi:diguanylate cyclase and metal dependent phosphohydrolase [Desulfofarcimen acetoxidans DSM 771]|uniref:Diguanylate cyclase and metal dependent phosphohydrolase n=1 Tax=Desulfofarcimen acetoxidans (strain ATCC 49208 / DSM 771 / KCTC 5769 / VKM B-1644 / 5575) TaxID=485916 RepID=C8W3P8_DESAS|nr:diguanylate cyclase [Desulfofarcimen acetoxidans]ACV63834.1 diguanylate cyclase and metal dependent phosphohydrolase [Desulfofarcimen acetoxidans DSM 771]
MNKWQNNSDHRYIGLINEIYAFCAAVFITAVIYKFWNINDFPNIHVMSIIKEVIPITVFLLSVLFGFTLIIKYSNVSAGIFILSIFIFIFIFGFQDTHLKTLLIIPVILFAFTRNKIVGCFVAIACGLSLVLIDIYFYKYDYPNRTLESDIIFTGVMLISAWLTGGITSIEREIREHLIDMANRDGLTGLYNHRFLQEYFKTLSEETNNTVRNISLILFDIDHFKYFNDTFGHTAGDEILLNVSNIVKNHISYPSIVARYGGDEFCILLIDYDLSSAYKLASEMSEKVEQLVIKNTEKLPNGKISITAGIANYPSHTKHCEKLIDLADQALYKAKKTSKNKVELYFNVLDSLNTSNPTELELLSSIKTLLSIINAKDRYTYGHSERVLEYSTLLAQKYGLPEEEIRLIEYGAYLHDIGKIEVDIEVLNSSGKPTEREWEILKQHPYWGSEIIKPIKSLEKVGPYILYHHENYNGTGYPSGLKDTSIPLGARIIRIADSFDAITTDRPYKKGKTQEEACEEILSLAGAHYDPVLSKIFVKAMREEYILKGK